MSTNPVAAAPTGQDQHDDGNGDRPELTPEENERTLRLFHESCRRLGDHPYDLRKLEQAHEEIADLLTRLAQPGLDEIAEHRDIATSIRDRWMSMIAADVRAANGAAEPAIATDDSEAGPAIDDDAAANGDGQRQFTGPGMFATITIAPNSPEAHNAIDEYHERSNLNGGEAATVCVWPACTDAELLTACTVSGPPGTLENFGRALIGFVETFVRTGGKMAESDAAPGESVAAAG